jgi:hypothetical protein
MEGIDKFSAEIKKVNLFIFDADGLFLTEYEANEKELNNAHAMYLNLPPGTYDLVCWGNLSEDYQLPVFEKGKTSVKEAMLSLKRTQSTVRNHPKSLFFGDLSKVQILPALQKKQVLTIDMIKDTKKIRVIAKGLPPKEIAENKFDCRITSVNGDYMFNNAISGNEQLWYVPQTSVNSEGQLVFDFVIMRELNDGSTRSELIFTYHPQNQEEKEIQRGSLTKALLFVSKTKDLDIEDYFELEVDISVDYTNGSATIQVKGWESIETEYPLG